MNESGATHVARWFKVPGLDDSCIFRDSTFSVRLQAQSRGCSKIERSNFGRASASSHLPEAGQRRCVPPEYHSRVSLTENLPQTDNSDISVAHPSFRVVSTASRAAPLRDWLSAEHANMFLPLPAQPMGRSEEGALLLRSGCPPANVDTLLRFASTYRTRMVPSEGALRVRRLGTRALLRIARRLARFPWDQDTRRMLERALLTEFLPATEKAGVDELLEDAGIKKISPVVRGSILCGYIS